MRGQIPHPPLARPARIERTQSQIAFDPIRHYPTELEVSGDTLQSSVDSGLCIQFVKFVQRFPRQLALWFRIGDRGRRSIHPLFGLDLGH